jgi:peptidoglycan/xylan/chitin deacetylase (PgdA/CDA1 family)
MSPADRLREDRFVIFLFHGVIECQTHAVRNYTRKHLEAETFAAILRTLLAAGGKPVSMDAIAERQSLPPKAFAVTFDDGFLNNLTVAAPILADLGIPATFYVTTDFIASNRMSWIDRIEYVLEPAPPGALSLPWAVRAPFDDDATKRLLLSEIRQRVKSDRRIEPDRLASDIQRQLTGAEAWSSADPLDQKMSWAEVAELAAIPGMSVGGHSHTHAILSFLSPEALAAELDTSLTLLRERAGIGPRHYSYPEGLAHCHSPAVIAALQARGVVICPTAEDGDNDHATDLFRLKRIMVA